MGKWGARRCKLALDSCSSVTRDLRVGDPGVLVDLAKQILTVDELKPPAIKSPESEPSLFEFPVRGFRDFADDLLVTDSYRTSKGLTNSAPRAGTSENESRLRKGR